MIFDDQWFELWYCLGEDIAPRYILVLATSSSKPTRYIVYDPQLSYRIVYEADDYQSAVRWLSEDEYELVEGREFPDDGYPSGLQRMN